MSIAIEKRTISIRKDFSDYLDLYKNKSKFINEALGFYINYLEMLKQSKKSFLENKIKNALDGEFYTLELSDNFNKNNINYIEAGEKLKKNLLLAIKD